VLPAIVWSFAEWNHAFSVVWRRHGSAAMYGSATGRRWIRCETFLDEVYVHKTQVPAEAWARAETLTAKLVSSTGCEPGGLTGNSF